MSISTWGLAERAEDRLPDGQPLIETSQVKKMKFYANFITDPQRGYPSIGLISGPAGIGKTIAKNYFKETRERRSRTGLPLGISLTVKTRTTGRALANDVITVLGETPRGRNAYELVDQVCEAIVRNALEFMLLDEADRLNEESFDVMRQMFDATGCPPIIIGLPTIENIIDRYEKFSSRVGPRFHFEPLPKKEILEVVLPQLVFPHWDFDLQKEEDQQMGEVIYKMCGPSLRKLRNLLQDASLLAEKDSRPRIDLAILKSVFEYQAPAIQQTRMKSEQSSEMPDENVSSFEIESERRSAARRRKSV